MVSDIEKIRFAKISEVLILILLEDGFWWDNRCTLQRGRCVLILILLEDGFWLQNAYALLYL